MTVHHTWPTVAEAGLATGGNEELEEYLVVHAFPDTIRGRINAFRCEEAIKGEFTHEGAHIILEVQMNGGIRDEVRHLVVFPDEVVLVQVKLLLDQLRTVTWIEMSDFTTELLPALNQHWRKLDMLDRLRLVERIGIGLALEDACPPELWRELQDHVDA